MIENETFQHYQVLRRTDGTLWELGRGAMGVTYKALDTSLHRTVALKVIRTESLHNDRARQRFVREARTAAGLNHPNVARVFHLGESTQSYFYAMEFVDGETVEARVRREGPLPPALALGITWQVANALRAAGKEGLVHRDIKPSNVMLVHEEDHAHGIHVKVIDFGLAKAARSIKGVPADEELDATITVAGFVGTPHYASPEQLDEKAVDARSDFYSLGVTLWYMLAGKPPFGGSVVQVMSQHLSRLPPFNTLQDLSPGTMALLRGLLEKDPAQRPQNATALREMIELALQTCGVGQNSSRHLPSAQYAGIASGSMAQLSGQNVDFAAPRRQRYTGGRGWRQLAVWLLLIISFVAIAGTVALAAWYVLGPDDALHTPAKSKNPAQKAAPSPSPTRAPGLTPVAPGS